MTRRERARRKLYAQRDADRVGVAAAEQSRFQPIHQRQFFLRRQGRMIGYVIRSAHKFVEGKDRGAMTRMNEPRRDGEVLVAVSLARSGFGGGDHPDTFAWLR